MARDTASSACGCVTSRVPGGDVRRPQPFTAKNDGIVQIENHRVIVEMNRASASGRPRGGAERGEPLSAKRGELFDDAGDGAIGEIQAAVDLGIVVASFALEHAREPERRPSGLSSAAPPVAMRKQR